MKMRKTGRKWPVLQLLLGAGFRRLANAVFEPTVVIGQPNTNTTFRKLDDLGPLARLHQPSACGFA
jgi:hypothetical protein